jgi:hypothetical protein
MMGDIADMGNNAGRLLETIRALDRSRFFGKLIRLVRK